jgi:hypothetical protein
LWTRALEKARRARPKARRKSSKGKSLLSKKRSSSNLGESAAVHHTQTSLLSFSDEDGKGDDDPAVVRTVENLSVVGRDEPASVQKKEVRSEGGIPSQ